jgi:hypothetical protein
MLKKFNAFMLSVVLSLSLWPAALEAQTLPLPGTPGPSLGDFNTNLYTLTKGVEAGSTVGVGNALSVSQTSGQSNCTQLGTVNMVHNVATSAGTGYVCLPAAIPGFFKVVLNQTGQTIDIYGGASPNQYVPGTQDTINGTAGNTAFALGSHQQAVCIVGTGGAWNCSAASNGTANPGVFTTLSASSTVSGAGFSAYLASPPAIGGTAAAAGTFTALTATGVATLSGQLVFTGQGPPTIASGACGATTNGAVVAGSTNQSGEITIGSASTTTCTVSFSATLGSAPLSCVVFPENAAAAATGTTVAYVSAITTGHFVITGSALANANYYYQCI